jgi:protein-tyrosine phosphatase
MDISWIVDGVLAASPLPKSDGDIRSLHQQGVRAILTLTERPLTARNDVSPDIFTKLGMTAKHIPVDDFTPPTAQQAEEAVAFIDQMEAEGKPVLVHCLAGQGRTGCVLHAYFLMKGHGLQDAKYQVSLKRPICHFEGLSDSQKAFVEHFAQGRTIQI